MRAARGFMWSINTFVMTWWKKVKIAHTCLPSIAFRSWSRFLAVSLQVMWVINSAVGCHYFPPCLQLPSRPVDRYRFRWLVNIGTRGVNSLRKTVTGQCRSCDLNPGRTAPESSTLTIRYRATPGPLFLLTSCKSDCFQHRTFGKPLPNTVRFLCMSSAVVVAAGCQSVRHTVTSWIWPCDDLTVSWSDQESAWWITLARWSSCYFYLLSVTDYFKVI